MAKLNVRDFIETTDQVGTMGKSELQKMEKIIQSADGELMYRCIFKKTWIIIGEHDHVYLSSTPF